MHLSIHSDCFLSDSVRDTESRAFDMPRGGLVRGAVVIAVAGLLAALTSIAEVASPASADPAPRALATFQGTAVNLMHREVIGH